MSPLDRMRSFDGFHACKSLRFHLCVVGSQSWRQDFYVMILVWVMMMGISDLPIGGVTILLLIQMDRSCCHIRGSQYYSEEPIDVHCEESSKEYQLKEM